MNININIANKHGTLQGAPVVICGNSDYNITFNFDEEWAEVTKKTARFVYTFGGKVWYKDVDFTGDTVAVPVFTNIVEVRVGVYAGNLRTTTPVRIPCEKSILCDGAQPSDIDQPWRVLVDLRDEVATKAPAIVTSAEGEYLTLTDSAAYPVQDLKLYVKASQSGTGDPTPTNIRPITHRESVRLFVFDSGAITHYDNTIALPENCGFGYVDYMRNKYVQTHGVFVFKGTENWQVGWAIGNSFRYSSTKIGKPKNYSAMLDGLLCSHYTPASHATVAEKKRDNVIAALYDVNAINIIDTNCASVAAFKAYLAEQYAAGTPVTVIYKLATPVEHDLEELPEIVTLYPTTVLSTDGEKLAVSYVADTKNYIDNKLNEIATAIVANA